MYNAVMFDNPHYRQPLSLHLQPDGKVQLYIVSLGVLAPYRNLGIGTALLNRALGACADDPAITHATLHVHVANEEALTFYKKRRFQAVQVVSEYYKRLDPQDAVVLVRRLGNVSHEK